MKYRKKRRVHPMRCNTLPDPMNVHIYGICIQKLRYFLCLYFQLFLSHAPMDKSIYSFPSSSFFCMTNGETSFFIRKRGLLHKNDIHEFRIVSEVVPDIPFFRLSSLDQAVKLCNLFTLNEERTMCVLKRMTQ